MAPFKYRVYTVDGDEAPWWIVYKRTTADAAVYPNLS